MIYLISAITLSVDAVAVSVTNALYFSKSKKLWMMPIYFGVFQSFMTLMGFLLGEYVNVFFGRYDKYIVFFILSFIGSKMVIEAFSENEARTELNLKTILLQAVATSLDALAIGVSFALLKLNAYIATITIGITTYFLCFLAIKAVKKMNLKTTKWTEILAGITLILLAINYLK